MIIAIVARVAFAAGLLAAGLVYYLKFKKTPGPPKPSAQYPAATVVSAADVPATAVGIAMKSVDVTSATTEKSATPVAGEEVDEDHI